MIKYYLKNIFIFILCIVFLGISGCNSIFDKSQDEDFKLDAILKEAAKKETNDELKEVVNQLNKTVPYSTKKVFNSFDDSDIYYVVSGGFRVMSAYCRLIAKDYSSQKAYETVNNMYKDLIDKHLGDLKESDIYAIYSYNHTALEVAKKTCNY